jgi:hypothetical protein
MRSAVLLALLAWPGTQAWVGDQAAREYEIKAAFLYNFAAYVEWPKAAFPEDGSPIVVCIVGNDPFGAALDRTLQGKTAQGRSLLVRRVATAKEAKGSHIVFLSSSESEHIAEASTALAGTPVLLVGESEGLARKGAIEPGRDADLVLFDPAARRTIRAADLHHTSDFTPYEGLEVAGAVRSTFVRGRAVVRDGAAVGDRGFGQFVERGEAGG